MKFARKTDLIIIAILAAAGVLVWVIFNGTPDRAGTVAEIYYKSELVKTIDLSKSSDVSFSLSALPNVVFHQYPDGSIAFIESDCPDKICIETGRLHIDGQVAACLPNQVYVKIVDSGTQQQNGPDIIIG